MQYTFILLFNARGYHLFISPTLQTLEGFSEGIIIILAFFLQLGKMMDNNTLFLCRLLFQFGMFFNLMAVTSVVIN